MFITIKTLKCMGMRDNVEKNPHLLNKQNWFCLTQNQLQLYF